MRDAAHGMCQIDFSAPLVCWAQKQQIMASLWYINFFDLVATILEFKTIETAKPAFRHVHREPSFMDVLKFFKMRLCPWDMHLT